MAPQRCERACEVHSQEAPATRVKERMIYQQQKQKAMQKTAGEQFTKERESIWFQRPTKPEMVSSKVETHLIYSK